MRVVTCGAHPRLDRGMDIALRKGIAIMAGEAEIRRILSKLEGFLALLRVRSRVSLMAGLARFGDGVDRAALQQLRVALVGDTSSLC